MSAYITKQRKALLNYFINHKDETVSAKQIYENLKDDKISVSSVYRNLSVLEQEGKLQRISKSDSREVFYRYTALDSCKECLHLSCKKCGKTFHLNNTGADSIVNALSSTEDFQLDKSNTILYGICKNCKVKRS